MARIHVGDKFVKIRLNAGMDISAATTIEIHYKKPDGTTGEWTATLEGTNYAYYYTLADTLDMNGTWTIQLYVEVGSVKAHGKAASFVVYDTLIDHS
jgi:hypothetical protein